MATQGSSQSDSRRRRYAPGRPRSWRHGRSRGHVLASASIAAIEHGVQQHSHYHHDYAYCVWRRAPAARVCGTGPGFAGDYQRLDAAVVRAKLASAAVGCCCASSGCGQDW